MAIESLIFVLVEIPPAPLGEALIHGGGPMGLGLPLMFPGTREGIEEAHRRAQAAANKAGLAVRLVRFDRGAELGVFKPGGAP